MQDNKQEMGGYQWLLAVFLLVTRIVASPLLFVRKWRGPRCESLAIRWAGVAAVPLVWASGGGGDPALLNAGCYTLAFFTLFGTSGWKAAVRKGAQLHSRFVGIPLVAVLIPRLQGNIAYAAEPALWGLVAYGFSLLDQPGWDAYFLAAGVISVPVEMLVIMRRDRTIRQDIVDARLAQMEVQDAISQRFGR